ncbi:MULTISPECIES: acetylglutamate kinase [Campylobacter]|uniref:Acetylglutamate kinase n=1 Tax=Campylobacter curvus (strain 525.92) TaxID=360105 RepID=ARGB_CAMC5|nr:MULTISPECIES: acetylglutamate kinase [Campylobacter]A7GXW0.1 RecName: Full=Acetylglutamate kinase; AltName: Full=N-acetyl-L-glutamate 5-phosphotransferase; AltName: Full=NAG kinase; Short=NAGK [Campylobacter curvus 525.92]EAU00238.1 acetylglutamate kinase [Campylobacter curvus 525.92]EJP75407.1 acetylglutamate kinase [Campylobacter sp. FOBRC14]
MQNSLQVAQVIISALPYIQKFRNKIFVVKYGGSAQIDDTLKNDFVRDIALLQLVGCKVVVVHGGGKKINSYLDRLHIKSEFVDGLRVTDKEAMEIVEMVLSGNINKEITALLNKNGARAIGVSGKDANLLKARILNNGKYGFVGEIERVNTYVLNGLLENGLIPVVAPVATDDEANSYNINADLCASKIASALKAERVIFLTDTRGILDKDGNLISKLNEAHITALKEDGTINGGMIPKVDAALECVKNGVANAHILDGRLPHSLLLELFTDDGIGTMIKG